MIVITSCTASKQDTIPIPKEAKTVQPSDYLNDNNLLEELFQVRNQIFNDPRANLGDNFTYAFDLYVNTGNAYKEIRKYHYEKIKTAIKTRKIQWFFLSGGYGIINALEPARKYQATFSRGIAYQNKIPFTAKLWGSTLTKICDNLIEKQNPKHVYIFGSRDYTSFIKKTHFWKETDKEKEIKIFESTGSAGPHWISKILGELAESTENYRSSLLDNKYPRFIKQNKLRPK